MPEARAWLEEHAGDVTLYSLDNDLYVPDFDGEPGEGWELHRVVPFMGMEWIGKAWIETVRGLMD